MTSTRPTLLIESENYEILRVHKTDHKDPHWLFELFTPGGRNAILVSEESGLALAELLAPDRFERRDDRADE